MIADVDDQLRRLAYAVVDGDSLGLTHHHASFEAVSEGAGRCRLVWLTDLLPHELVEQVRVRMLVGAEEIRATLQQR